MRATKVFPMFQIRHLCGRARALLASAALSVSPVLIAAAVLAPLPAAAVTLTGAQLAAVAPNSGSASFSSAAAPGLVLTVTELAATTMVGSDLDHYEGLWLGSLGNGGQYRLGFNLPVQSVSISFIALTVLPEEGAESLQGFTGDQPLVITFSSADGSARWDGSHLLPLEEDSRASLQFSPLGAAGFFSLSFSHLQPAQLQGLVVDRIDFLPLAVPELPTALMLALGGIAVAFRARRLTLNRGLSDLSV